MDVFTHTPHPHIEARKVRDASRPSWNLRLGAKITQIVGTMWAAYVFAILALASLPAALLTANVVIIIGWVAQTFLQLVLLPVIMVGQNVQSAAADKRSEQTYNDAEAILHECLQLQAHLQAQDAVLAEAIQRIEVDNDSG